jgi:Protein of unknown function (DUF2442)
MIKILSAEILEGGVVELEFSNNAKGIFNLQSYLANHSGDLLVALRESNYAKRCFIDAGALCWPNGLELSPSRLYELCLELKAA